MRNFRRSSINNKYVPRDAKSRLAQKISSIKSGAARRFRAEEDEDEEEYDDDTFFFAGKSRSAEAMAKALTKKWEGVPFYKESVTNKTTVSMPSSLDADDALILSELRETFLLLDYVDIGLDMYFEGRDNSVTVGMILDEYDSRHRYGYYNDHDKGRGILCKVTFSGGETDEAIASKVHTEVVKALETCMEDIRRDIKYNLL